MKTPPLFAIALALLCTAVPAVAAEAAEAAEAVDPAAVTDGQAATLQPLETEPAKPTRCVRQTGTRIARHACQPGRVYTRDDLRRTGATDVADALRRLDPSVGIRRR